jgi:hypothetical protein
LRHLSLSLVAGIVVSALFVVYWERGYADSAVTVLGSGDGLSALIDVDATRILVVSGNDPGEFSNALAGARPGQTPRIDLIVVAPGADAIAARAIAIAHPKRVLVIDAFSDEPSTVDWPAQTTVVSTASTIVIKDRARVEIDPGHSIDRAMAGWSVRIHAGDGDVLISQRAPLAYPVDIDAFVIAGPDPGVVLPSKATRIASSAIDLGNTGNVIGIDPGETLRIEV